ncbi:hypothetical protein GOV13_02035 [Candidatus Pacearchaeota archaeon]|nr:hypothetical protein [Candidatus Pacearchaeota archaeon]
MINLLIFLLYILVIFSVTYYYRLKRERPTQKNYLVSNRELGTWDVAFSSSAAVFSSAGVLFAFGLALAFGMPGFGIMVAFLLTPLLLAIFAPALNELAREKKILTLSDIIRERFGLYSEKIYAFISVAFMFGWMVGAFNINIALLERFLEVDKYFATIISFSIVITYLTVGGFRAIVKTDKLQFLVMLLFSITMVSFINNPVPVAETIDFSLWFSGAFWLLAPVFFWGNIANTAAWQPVIAARNGRVARNGMLLSVILGFLFYGPIIWLSSTFARDLPGINPNLALFEGIGTLFPNFLTPLLFIAVYAAMMSTLDTSLFYTASNTIKNLFPKKLKENLNEVALIKLFLILFAFVAIISSFFIEGFVEFTIAIFPIIGITAFPLLFGLFTKLPDKGVFSAMILGLISFFYLFFFPPENSLWNMFPALSTGFVILLLLFFKNKN